MAESFVVHTSERGLLMRAHAFSHWKGACHVEDQHPWRESNVSHYQD
jgi:hypothetical protein